MPAFLFIKILKQKTFFISKNMPLRMKIIFIFKILKKNYFQNQIIPCKTKKSVLKIKILIFEKTTTKWNVTTCYGKRGY